MTDCCLSETESHGDHEFTVLHAGRTLAVCLVLKSEIHQKLVINVGNVIRNIKAIFKKKKKYFCMKHFVPLGVGKHD